MRWCSCRHPCRSRTNPGRCRLSIKSTRHSWPGLLPIVVGTAVRFPNHDQIHHHVYSFSPTKTFELPLYKGEAAAPVVFDKVGAVKIGCNIHDWMSGIILVLPSPHFAVTDSAGHFVLGDMPGGTYTLVAWHALSKLKPEETAQSVQVGEEVANVTFKLPLAPGPTSTCHARKPGGPVRWWGGRSLRTRIFAAFSVLIVAVLLATLGVTQVIVGRDAGRTLSRELRTTGQVFESLLRERGTRLQTNSTLLASDLCAEARLRDSFRPRELRFGNTGFRRPELSATHRSAARMDDR